MCIGQVIVDETGTNMVAMRKMIYLTIQSSMDFEEAAHKLLKLELPPGQEACYPSETFLLKPLSL